MTVIEKGYVRSDAPLDFNPGRKECNDIFDSGQVLPCWKVPAIEYRSGECPMKTSLCESKQYEPYSVYLPTGGGSPDVPLGACTCNGRDSVHRTCSWVTVILIQMVHQW